MTGFLATASLDGREFSRCTIQTMALVGCGTSTVLDITVQGSSRTNPSWTADIHTAYSLLSTIHPIPAIQPFRMLQMESR